MIFRQFVVKLAYAFLRRGVQFNNRFISRFVEDQKLIGLLNRLKIECVIDVGANKGLYAKHLRMLGYKGVILCFEPIDEDANAIRAMSADDETWSVFNFALGSSEEVREFKVIMTGDQTVFSSFLQPKAGLRDEQIRSIRVRRFDNVVNELIPEIKDLRLFMKCDTQGFDVEVVKGAGSRIDQILGLQSELSVIQIYEGMPRYNEALNYYESLGFSLFDLNVVNRTHDGAILEYDCLMAKRDRISGNF